jgi:hypothetical protein
MILTEKEAEELNKIIFTEGYEHLPSNEKLAICKELYKKQTTVSGFKGIPGGYAVETGLITEEPKEFSGLWGYGGDSVAIYINGKALPSWTVVCCQKYLNKIRVAG